ncbi:MAG: phosphatase PAP2 family protein [Lewinellaceae bacterium]|nr:phosphatase PAP2 family protein [Lewinellaceae bacterium]
MYSYRQFFLILLFLGVLSNQANAAIAPTYVHEHNEWMDSNRDTLEYYPSIRNFILPTAAIGYGFASVYIPNFNQVNVNVHDAIDKWNLPQSKLDNFTQFAPAVLVYGLNAVGIHGKHGLWDRTLIYGLSQAYASSFVVPLKHIIKEQRPDGSDALSFPSGHTSSAFASAQFMYREYKDTHPWISVSGYSFALFTGVYRMVNNRHWFGDVVAGAGFGVLATELSYLTFSTLKKHRTKNAQNAFISYVPFYNSQVYGMNCVMIF